LVLLEYRRAEYRAQRPRLGLIFAVHKILDKFCTVAR